MKIKVSNLGVLLDAQLDLGNFTIICGKNNTGKTYATYALYGFLISWKNLVITDIIKRDKLVKLWDSGTLTIQLSEFIPKAPKILDNICIEYNRRLPRVFASNEKHFENTKFKIDLEGQSVEPMPEFYRSLGTGEKNIFRIMKESGSDSVGVTLLSEDNVDSFGEFVVHHEIARAIQEILFGKLFPEPFISSAERTGAAIFRSELDFARNRLIDQLKLPDKNIDPFELIVRVDTNYAIPVTRNVDFIRQLDEISKKDSFISKEHRHVLEDFQDIIGGEYKIKSEDLYFVPAAKKQVRLSMDESSSAVRSLLDLGFYLRHIAKPGDLLMLDEPELNLHPENQRRIARLFTRLIKLGINIFITTHSDYIIKEINTLILLNNESKTAADIMKEYGYKTEELIESSAVKVFIAKEDSVKPHGYQRKRKGHTLIEAHIDPELGIETPTFDDTIEEMNKIQEALLFVGEE